MSYTTESQAAGSHILPNLVRAFAVLGIVLIILESKHTLLLDNSS